MATKITFYLKLYIIVLLGTYTLNAQITSYPYVEDFETGDGGWTVYGTKTSWERGIPSGIKINNAASGDYAWVTNASGNYLTNENGWIQSPIFNFSSLTNPSIQFSINNVSEYNVDGAVIQTSTDSGVTWQNIGFAGDGETQNWFSSNNISSQPGGQSVGWTGHWSAEWHTVRHYLNGLGGQSNVIIRIAFASNETQNYEGVAFDFVRIFDELSTFPYVEDFETGKGGWVSGGTNSSWEHRSLNPDFLHSSAPLKYAAFGEYAWVTSTAFYNNDENSWVQSPAFDLSSLTTPHIQLKIWYDCETGSDGAVLQSSTDSGSSWQNVGDIGQGTNWFNDSSISSSPGGQSKGWSGAKNESDPNLSKESIGWVTAIMPISNLAGEANVIFRIAFSSNNSIDGPGFAFDYVQISNTSCYAGDNIKPDTIYCTSTIDELDCISEFITNLNDVFSGSSKTTSGKPEPKRRFKYKRGPRRVFVRDNGVIDFPNTGRGLEQEYIFEYTNNEVTCNGVNDVGFIILTVGGNDHGGENFEEHGCYITDDDGVQLSSSLLFDAISLEGIRCQDDLDNGFWYDENGVEINNPTNTTVTEGVYTYEGCSTNTAIITISKENNCNEKDIDFSFNNAVKYSDGSDYFFEVDVMVSALYSGSFKLGRGVLYFNYNTEAFGEDINANGNFEVLTDGSIVEQKIDIDSSKNIYDNSILGDTSTSMVSWGFYQIYSSSTFAEHNVTKTPTKLCRLKLKYQDETKDPMIEFVSAYPLDNRFWTACGPEAGGSTEFADCTESGEPGFLIRNDNFSSYISEITLSSIAPELIESKFTLYPNPASDMLHVKGNLTLLKEIEIYTLTGQHIKTLKEQFSNINISQLNPSIYFVKLKTNTDSKTFKIVKK